MAEHTDASPGIEVRPEPLGGRPYQGRPRQPERARVGQADADRGVRPYVLTGGRSRSSNALVGFETMVSLTDEGRQGRPIQRDERRAILDRCDHAVSVVELSAYLRVPLGVAQVLTGDLVDEG